MTRDTALYILRFWCWLKCFEATLTRAEDCSDEGSFCAREFAGSLLQHTQIAERVHHTQDSNALQRANLTTTGGRKVNSYRERLDQDPQAEEAEEEEEDLKVKNWIIQLVPDASGEDIDKVCLHAYNISRIKCARKGRPSLGGIGFLVVRMNSQDLESLIESVETIAFTEEDAVVHATYDNVTVAPKDTAQTRGDQKIKSWALDRIDARYGLDDSYETALNTTGRNVHIYILDTGIDTSHPDFEGRAIPTLDATVVGEECKGNPMCALDLNGHGTNVAGAAGSKTFGVAKASTLHAVKVLGDDGRGMTSNTLAAMDWIASNAEVPAVVTMSFVREGASSAQQVAIEHLATRDITVVVAAGNDDADACQYSPASVSSAITVGSIGIQDDRSDFSNFGGCVDMWAPGSDVPTTGLKHDWERSSSTSIAASFVAGGAALVLSFNAKLTHLKVEHVIGKMATRDVLFNAKNSSNLLLYVGKLEPSNVSRGKDRSKHIDMKQRAQGYEDLGEGLCLTAEGKHSEDNVVMHAIGPLCVKECDYDETCTAYSVNERSGMCIMWRHEDVQGGGVEWFGGHCFRKSRIPALADSRNAHISPDAEPR